MNKKLKISPSLLTSFHCLSLQRLHFQPILTRRTSGFCPGTFEQTDALSPPQPAKNDKTSSLTSPHNSLSACCIVHNSLSRLQWSSESFNDVSWAEWVQSACGNSTGYRMQFYSTKRVNGACAGRLTCSTIL